MTTINRNSTNSNPPVDDQNNTQNTNNDSSVNDVGDDDVMTELTQYEGTQGNTLTPSQIKALPPQQRQALLQAALQNQQFGMDEFSFKLNGQLYTFSTEDVVSTLGGEQAYKTMSGQGNMPGPQQPYGSDPYNNPMGGSGNGRSSITAPSPYGDPYGGGYGGGGYGNGGYGGYGYNGMNQNQFLWDQMMGGQQRDGINTARSQIRKAEQEMKVKMSKIMFMILMGDVPGAMREMIAQSENLNRLFNRTLVQQLDKVRAAKSKILMAMGRKRPPTAHDNTNDPAGAARDQNKQAKYTQWVSVTTQLMSEVQQTERELLDLLSEGRRNINDLWEAYSGLKEAEARTTRTVIQAFRG